MKKFIVGLIKLSCLCGVVAGCMAELPVQDNQSELSGQQQENTSDQKADNKASYQLIKGADVVIDGKVYPLCRDLLKNFNHFAHEPPMICGRKFEPSLGFTIPDWQPVTMDAIHWDLVKQIYYDGNKKHLGENIDQYWLKEDERLQGLVAKGQTILWQAMFDIDNKAGKEQLLLLRDNNCNIERDFGTTAPDPSIHVVDATGRSIDKDFDRLNRYSFDVFRYKNATYLASWRGREVNYGGGQIYIYEAFRPHANFGFSSKRGCAYKYLQ